MNAARRSRASIWWGGARPRTLPASIVPVAIGTALAPRIIAWRCAATFAVALALQIGVNYANDYFDGMRGVDTAERRGPVRLVASGLAPARAVALAATACFAIAGVVGLALAIAASPWLLAAGAAAIGAAVLYSGGPKPYASLGLGEAFVFVFFGLVAVCGTVYAQSERLSAGAWWCGAASGLLAVALLLVNNLRDIPTDAATGKRTLAVRMGDPATRIAYRSAVLAGIALPAIGSAAGALPAISAISLVAIVFASKPLHAAGRARGAELVPVLVATAATQLLFGGVLVLALVIARIA